MRLGHRESAWLAPLLLFLAPFFAPYLLNPWPVTWSWAPAWALCFVAVCLLSSKEMKLPPGFWPVLVAVGLLILWPSLFAGQWEKAALQVGWIVTVALLFLLGFSMRPAGVRGVYLAFSIAAALWVFVALFVWFGGSGGEALHLGVWALSADMAGKPSGPFVSGNVFGILTTAAWGIALWQCSRKGSHWLWWVALVGFWLASILCLSRTVWLLQSVIWLVAVAILWKRNKKLMLAVGALGVLVWIVVQPLMHHGGGSSKHKLDVAGRIEATAKHGLGERQTIWQSAWQIWRAHPLAGVGVGNFGAHYLDAQARVLADQDASVHGLGATDSAHNILLHALAETGIAGGLAIVAMLGWLLRQVWLHAAKMHSLRWPALMIVSLLFLQGFTNISLTTPYPLLFLFLFLGIYSRPMVKRPSRLTTKPAYALAAMALALSLFAGGWSQAVHWRNFEIWLQTSGHTREKARLTNELLQDPSTLPYVVGQTVWNVLKDPERYALMVGLRPYILRAMAEQQRPVHYQGLFWSYVMAGDYSKACQVGRIIEEQHWRGEQNHAAYAATCKGKRPDQYEPGWQ